MLKYLGNRILQMFGLFLVFLTLLFIILELQPGDLTNQFIGNPQIPPEARQILAETLGLDRGPVERYFIWMGNFFRGELGVSMAQFPRTVSDMIFSALPRTFVLFLSATVLAYWLGFLTGKQLAWGRGERSEMPITLIGVGLNTVFYPWFALLSIWFWASFLTNVSGIRFFPIQGFIDVRKWSGTGMDPNVVFNRIILVFTISLVVGYFIARSLRGRVETANIGWVTRVTVIVSLTVPFIYFFFSELRMFAFDIFHHMLLPVATLATVSFAGIMLLTRSSMLETVREDYILTARAKGLPNKIIRDRHAARNAMLPVTTSLVLALAGVIGGGIITESIFGWTGIGLLLLESIQRDDIPVAMAALAFLGVLGLIAHLVADIIYMYLDPRIRYH